MVGIPTEPPYPFKCLTSHRWPGVLAQFVWSWIIAPYVLWKSRNIQDTQGWRVQTIGCAIAK